MTHTLSFVLRTSEAGATVATPCIDGVRLSTLIEQFETSRGMTDPAGGYDGLFLDYLGVGSIEQYFLGLSNHYAASSPGRIYTLGCDCGVVECWPLACTVTVNESHVSWHSFSQPHRRKRNYSEFGPFVFELDQYTHAVRGLPASSEF